MDSIFKNFWYKKPANVNKAVDSFGGYHPNQPSQKYPFIPIKAPRVDNQNQPWYGGDRWWDRSPDNIQTVDAVAKAPQTGSDRYALSSGWGFLSDWFGGNTAKANLTDKSSVYGVMNNFGGDSGTSGTRYSSGEDDL